jgi:tRNA-2-methylthio-N6-dimethylallyladenosine synthase
MQGCDNYCTYCVVPYVRGPEMSRHPDRILVEIEALVHAGVREVILLGQNVNSYGLKEGLPSFAELLTRVDRVEGLSRIRFTTSHPKDLSDDLMGAFGKLAKLCPHIHLPVQSGSDQILKRMNRNYTRQVYLDRIERLRSIRPDIAVTSDFIVGFPGESRRDFEQTLSLVKQVAFDGIFAFMYSDRDIAPALHFKGKVDESVKKDRLQELLATQEAITLGKHQALIGSVQRILVEGGSSRPGLAETDDKGPQWTGRTPGNKIVNFNGAPDAIPQVSLRVGQLVDVQIERAFSHSLGGRRVSGKPSKGCLEGKKYHAA